MRCVHEASLHAQNCFITLTYNDENLPADESLNKEHWQLFMKRLRDKIKPIKIRFFMGAEYGENQDVNSLSTIGRPHYHAILFGYDFPDKELYKNSDNGPIYTSEILSKVWGKGFVTIAEMSFDTAAYVARYCVKKINGEPAELHYQKVNPITGEITNLQPEFALSSRRPGIAHDWFMKYKSDLHKGYIVHNGVTMGTPKYYDSLLQKYDDARHASLKESKSLEIDVLDPETNSDRLRVRETVRKRRTKTLKKVKL